MTVPYRFRFRTKQLALQHWQRERDHGRLFLNAAIYLHLPGRRRKLVLFRADEQDVIDSISKFFEELSSGSCFETDDLLMF
jgi:hypothetical protein